MDNKQVLSDLTTSSASAGALLRHCRELKAISLEEAAEATKISKRFLHALEEDRYDAFASPAYLKGFLKNYAVYLGLQPDELLAKLNQNHTEQSSSLRVVSGKSRERRILDWRILLLPSVLLAALVLIWLIMYPSQQPAIRALSPLPPPAASIQPSLSSAGTPPAPLTTPTHSDAPSTAPAAAAPTQQTGIIAKMKALKNGTLGVTIDEGSTQTYDLTSGDLIEWKADRSVSFELSDAAGVELELNGKPLKINGQPGKPVSFVLDAGGIRK